MMALPEHLIVEHITSRLCPKDQWSVACCSKSLYTEFLAAHPDFINNWDWEANVVRRLTELEKVLARRRRGRGDASLSFFNISKMETFTLKSGGVYIFERKKGGRMIWNKVIKSDEALKVFRESVIPEIRAGRVKLVIENNKGAFFDPILKLFSD